MPACDGRTDRQTDVKPIAITCFSIADARKNWKIECNVKWFVFANTLYNSLFAYNINNLNRVLFVNIGITA